jgi:Na+-driven multidrug efflux pump
VISLAKFECNIQKKYKLPNLPWLIWVLEMPLALYTALHLGWGATGVFWSVAMCHSLLALVSVYIFKKGRWKLVKV